MMFVFLQVGQPSQAVLADSVQPQQNTQHSQNLLYPSQNPQQFAREKQQLSFEYMDVLHGKESKSVFESHYQAFMNKWNLGASQNLDKALTTSYGRKQAASALATRKISPLTQPNSGTVSAVGFPEVFPNYCGNATISTMLVEDSFAWPGTTNFTTEYGVQYNISYDPYSVQQPSSTAQQDEDMIAQNTIYDGLGNVYYRGLNNTAPRDQNQVGPDVTAANVQGVLNQYISGKGGFYTFQSGNSNFVANLITDVQQGWDAAVGLDFPANTPPVLPGWSYADHDRKHWIAATYIDSGADTEIADPVSGASSYFSSHGYDTSIPPHETLLTNIVLYRMIFYIW